MKKYLLLACLLFSLCLPGCGIGQRSPETRYYVLALPAGSAQPTGERTITGPSIGIGPITTPAYLERQQIFIRQGDSPDVRLSEYDRWGEDFGEGITRLLVDITSAKLADIGGIVLPLRAANSMALRISVNINRFDGAPDGEVTLDADWGLYTAQGERVKEGHFLNKVHAGPDIDGLVRAHGELLIRLSETLAETVRSTTSKKPARR